jgi:NitT/TauT family transport system permease protein
MSHRVFRFFLHHLCPPLMVFIVVAVGAQLIIKWQQIPGYMLPLPSDVARALITDRQDLLRSTWTTTQAALIGFGGSVVIGIAAAILLSTSVWIRRAFYPYTLFFQTVPIIAVAPLLIIWFEAGLPSVSISAFIVSVFPVIANTLSGLLGTDPALMDLFTLYGATPWHRLVKLRLPYAMPSIFTGLRVAAGLAVIGTIVGEFVVGLLGTDEGLGVRIVGAKKNGHLDVVFAAVLLASLLGLFLFGMVNLLGRLVLRRWKEEI